ncbi:MULTISPECIES: OmpW/AlkL family protein [Pseudomonas]|uniref:Outer membrane beta-barrel protein n=1 Tax=Pseudomonas simiae TaxID=321846 RepID=A0ABS9GEL5_9PSED|nr:MULTISPECIES: OmpW family outer membrane protein [Pseudomonas]MCF5188625.1 outer membrane beta-barrel protein [Pseudomonas simiae]MCF5289477.1 outer membrane beta-barrel protein [Pseudomonas simiae]MCF5321795.1 outer membrane beta-barrel protein [Pseudomonas simiae]MCF5338367.1 outer membrane beta-barrel protein [Pseudomonas simiae]MCF5343941.1 outer membrane beta-barrel protein [Pseudomonas simiae]
MILRHLQCTWSTVSFASLMTFSASVFAYEDVQSKIQAGINDRWLLRVMALEIIPVELASEISTIGGNLETPRTRQIGIDLSYSVTENWVVEFQGGPFDREYRIKGSRIGDFKVGSISQIALSMSLQYHFYPNAQWSPYVGLGLNHTWTRDVKPAAGIPKFEVREITSGIMSTGLDYRLSRYWTLSTSLRYVISPKYEFQGQGFNSTVSMNTLVVGGGVGYRF